MTDKILLSWSSGKDSALALHVLRQEPEVEVVALLTTVTADCDRVSMHGVRRSLVIQQAKAIGLPLEEVPITAQSDNDDYQRRMREVLTGWRKRGVSAVAIGDIFLEDLRRYREENLAQVGLRACFPLWKRATADLAEYFIECQFRAIVTCVDTEQLDASFAGREYDRSFLDDLPAGVDPCGENGEFHTFVHAGPILRHPLDIRRGETVLRDGRFAFCDVLPYGNEPEISRQA